MLKLIFNRFSISVVAFCLVLGGGPVIADKYFSDHETTVYEYLYYIEGTGSYYLPGPDYETFFNQGKWYRSDGDEWFMSEDLNGPWSGMLRDSLPRDLAELPADFKTTRKLGTIPYRYVIGSEKPDEGYFYRYQTREYYERYGYRGHSRYRYYRGSSWLFASPGFYDDGWYYRHPRKRKLY